ncbi:MAG: hypothetical protein ACIAQ0_10720 [Phycisphaerales bacterium JB058]
MSLPPHVRSAGKLALELNATGTPKIDDPPGGHHMPLGRPMHQQGVDANKPCSLDISESVVGHGCLRVLAGFAVDE